MKDHTIPPPPASLDLGDLAGLQIGSEVVSVCPERGNQIGETVYLVDKLEGWRVVLRRADTGKTIGGWQTKNHGGTRGMFGPVYYYSANPAHIATAKAQAKAARIAKEAKDAAHAAQMALARPIGLELGDGERCDPYGEPYDSETAADTLAEHLTAEQLRTLADWLKLPGSV